MTTHHAPSSPQAATPVRTPVSPGRAFLGWFVGIVGAVAVFLGTLMLFGPEDQSIGFGGDASWEIGEISAWWGIGFLAGGFLVLLAVVISVVQRRY